LSERSYLNFSPLASPGGVLLVKCTDLSSDSLTSATKLFELPQGVRYWELQEVVNRKFGNVPVQILYEDEYGD